ncbi:hypothetical protein YC2023_045190 [Brassica napus]
MENYDWNSKLLHGYNSNSSNSQVLNCFTSVAINLAWCKLLHITYAQALETSSLSDLSSSDPTLLFETSVLRTTNLHGSIYYERGKDRSAEKGSFLSPREIRCRNSLIPPIFLKKRFYLNQFGLVCNAANLLSLVHLEQPILAASSCEKIKSVVFLPCRVQPIFLAPDFIEPKPFFLQHPTRSQLIDSIATSSRTVRADSIARAQLLVLSLSHGPLSSKTVIDIRIDFSYSTERKDRKSSVEPSPFGCTCPIEQTSCKGGIYFYSIIQRKKAGKKTHWGDA